MATHVTTNNNHSSPAPGNMTPAVDAVASLQDVSIPRRKVFRSSSLERLGNNHKQHHKYRQSESSDERGRIKQRHAAEDDYHPRGRTKSTSHHRHNHQHGEHRRSHSSSAAASIGRDESRHSNSSSSNSQQHRQSEGALAERRHSSSTSSVKSASSSSSGSTTSSTKSGFRRLKKFSKSKSSSSADQDYSSLKKKDDIPTTTTTTSATAFTKPSKPNTSTPQPPRESSAQPSEEDKSTSPQEEEDLSVSDKFQQVQLRLWKAAQERNLKMQQLQEQKKLKKLKKKQLKLKQDHQAESLPEEQSLPMTPNASMESSASTLTTYSDESPTTSTKKKKKRRLFKMGSSRSVSSSSSHGNHSNSNREDDGDETVPRKKIKTETPLKSEKPSATTTSSSSPAMFLPSTPTMSFGLADTVKTRVRSCTKNSKDKELELLQAASFEKKKRKKQRLSDETETSKASRKKDKMKVNDQDGTDQKTKKKKKHIEYVIDEQGNQVPVKRKRGRPPKNRSISVVEATSTAYDADVEPTADVPVVKKKRGRPPKKKSPPAEESLPSETSSACTIPTCHQLKTSSDISRAEHLHFKKRMAAAAAADTSCSWNQHNHSNACGGTTASKISISSGGSAGVAAPELESSSISEFTHPTVVDHTAKACCAAMMNPEPSSVPPEIFSKSASTPTVSSFDLSMGNPANVIGPTFLSSDSSDDSSDSETDEEELYMWANKMFGTNAVPKKEAKKEEPLYHDMPPEMCEMERRRQQQEQARTLSAREVRAILKEDEDFNDPMPGNWVRRSMRQPSRSLLNTSLVRKFLDKLRGNDSDMVVLKMKKYLSDPDTPQMAIDAALEALEECTVCESLYIQNFNKGMRDKQVLDLLRILQMPTCNIWCLNIGETYNVSDETWETFANGLKKTKITHMYASEHTITTELKDQIRETIRANRKKHNMHCDPNNLDVIIQCTHCWWNPINTKVLRPYIRKRGLETLLHDKEAQGLRGSKSDAPGGSPPRDDL